MLRKWRKKPWSTRPRAKDISAAPESGTDSTTMSCPPLRSSTRRPWPSRVTLPFAAFTIVPPQMEIPPASKWGLDASREKESARGSEDPPGAVASTPVEDGGFADPQAGGGPKDCVVTKKNTDTCKYGPARRNCCHKAVTTFVVAFRAQKTGGRIRGIRRLLGIRVSMLTEVVLVGEARRVEVKGGRRVRFCPSQRCGRAPGRSQSGHNPLKFARVVTDVKGHHHHAAPVPFARSSEDSPG